MSTPDQRARDRDRDAAIEVVEAAWADGQIIDADRDKRVEELLRAQTLGEIQMLTHDLQPVAPTSPAQEGTPVPDVAYGPPVPVSPGAPPTSARSGKIPKAVFIIPLVVVLVIVISAAGGLVALIGPLGRAVVSSPDHSSGGTPRDGKVITARGYADLVDAIEEQTGSTEAFTAVLYPSYAVADLPVDATSRRVRSYDWDGRDLTDRNSTSTSTFERFDLRSVDPAVVVRLVERVKRLSDKPTTWYAILRTPSDDRTLIWAYASNDYNESVYVGARRDGTIVYDSTNP